MTIKLILAAAVAAAVLSPVAASANTYDWSFSNATDSGSGTFTTATPWTPAGVDILSFTGDIDADAISAFSGYAGADNKLYSTLPFVSQGGISLTTAADTYNIANINNAGAPGLIKESVDPGGASNGEPITFTVTSVPEPATSIMAQVAGSGTPGAPEDIKLQLPGSFWLLPVEF